MIHNQAHIPLTRNLKCWLSKKNIYLETREILEFIQKKLEEKCLDLIKE